MRNQGACALTYLLVDASGTALQVAQNSNKLELILRSGPRLRRKITTDFAPLDEIVKQLPDAVEALERWR